MRTLTVLVLVAAIVNAAPSASSASEPRWIDSDPGSWSILPETPDSGDVISFSGPTGVHSNECYAMREGGGTPTIVIDSSNDTVELWFQPPAPLACQDYWDPVYGLEGEFGPLNEGDWVFFGTNPIASFSVPFTVVPEPAALSLLALGAMALIRRRRLPAE